MSETASLSTGIAGRYAKAVFELAKEGGALGQLEQDVGALDAALRDSDDLRAMISSPLYARDDQNRAITAVADRMGLGDMTTKVLGLMASKRRLFVLPQMLRALRERIAAEKGEVTAEVTSARGLSDAQRQSLSRTLAEKVGRDVNIRETVDESLIGGLVVKVGSKMIDTSIRSKLASLQNIMKEAR